MASIHKRKQLVNQLRKAHFPFGFQRNYSQHKFLETKDIQSEYIERYKKYALNGITQPNNNARKDNFDLIDGNAKDSNISEFKQKFPEYPLNSRSGLVKPQESKNIVFGYDGSSYGTNYKDDYIKKQKQQALGKPQNQKKPNIEFGDALTDFTTTYNKIYDDKGNAQRQVTAPSMRKTNMILGNDGNNFVTQHNAAYQPVPTANYHAAKGNNQSNINLGGDKGAFTSQHHINFAHKQAPKYTVDKETVRDFRSAHFHLGFPAPDDKNLSEAQQQYNEKPIDFVKAKGNRDSNIDMNVDGNTYFNSSYGNDYQQKEGDRAPLIKTGQVDNVLMGTDDPKGLYESQAKAQFGDKLPGQLVRGQKPKNNLDLGDMKTDYLTQYQKEHIDKFGQRQNSRLTDQQIRRLKDKNFNTGFQNNTYSLTSAHYGQRTGPANKLTKQTLDGMKNTNIHTGEGGNIYGNSIYKTSFPWKKNDEY